jgi:hypothetical protein
MIATSNPSTYFFKRVMLTILMVIITLPGTHLLANEIFPTPLLKTKAENLQLSQAVREAETRMRNFFKNQETKPIEINIALLPSAAMNYHLAGFVPKSKTGNAAILINANWLEYGMTDEALVRLILEGTGALIEYQLKGQITDGGQLLANNLSNIYRDADKTPQKAAAIQLNGIETKVYFQ